MLADPEESQQRLELRDSPVARLSTAVADSNLLHNTRGHTLPITLAEPQPIAIAIAGTVPVSKAKAFAIALSLPIAEPEPESQPEPEPEPEPEPVAFPVTLAKAKAKAIALSVTLASGSHGYHARAVTGAVARCRLFSCAKLYSSCGQRR